MTFGDYFGEAYLLELQRKKEDLFFEAAKGMNSEKVLIVCDRGILDNKAYMTDIFDWNGIRCSLALASYLFWHPAAHEPGHVQEVI